MKLTQIDNACCIYEANGFKLLCDPWLTDGGFEGSWYHYPPLTTTFNHVKDVDALYISHLHPDHYDETILKQFRKDIPVIILDKEPNFLKRKLESVIGFTNLIPVQDGKTITIGPMEVTVYAPFVNHPFDHSSLGNFIDSAIVVEANGKVILNANDNTPSEESAKMLREKHGPFSVAQLKDALAGAYPSCFLNLSDQEKLSEVQRLIKRQLTAMVVVAKILETEWFQPFAGDYQLGGFLNKKNRFLGVPGKEYSARFIANAGIKPLVLSEQGSIDLVTGELKAPFRKNVIPYEKWCESVSQLRYKWELDPEVTYEELLPNLIKARNRLHAFQDKHNYYPAIKIHVNDFVFDMSLSNPVNYVKFIMDNRVLARILDRRGHWNNYEVGCHIDVERVPNIYDPDLVNAMCFFHI